MHLDEILVYSLNHYIVVIVVGSPPYVVPRSLQTHPFIPARNSSSLPAASHVQCLHESPQCFDVMITDIIIKWGNLHWPFWYHGVGVNVAIHDTRTGSAS